MYDSLENKPMPADIKQGRGKVVGGYLSLNSSSGAGSLSPARRAVKVPGDADSYTVSLTKVDAMAYDGYFGDPTPEESAAHHPVVYSQNYIKEEKCYAEPVRDG